MRETSYFKNQTDDEVSTFAAAQINSQQLNQQSNYQVISNHISKQQNSNFNQNSYQVSQQTNSDLPNSLLLSQKQNETFQNQLSISDISKYQQNFDRQQQIQQIDENQEHINSNQNTNIDRKQHESMNQNDSEYQRVSRGSQKQGTNLKEGIQMFKIQSKSQLRWNRQGKKSRIDSRVSNGEFHEQNFEQPQPISPTSNDDGYRNLNVQTQDFNDLIDQFPTNYQDQYQINSANLFLNKSPLALNRMTGKENETDVKNQKESSYTQNISGRQNQKEQQMKQLNKRNLFESHNLIKSEEDREFKVNDQSLQSQNNQNNSEVKQMFTSMSDIGFPQNIHNYNIKQNTNSKKDLSLKANQNELISLEQIQRLMNTQNNWRVRTMTIDQILHDIQQKVEDDPEEILKNSEKYLDFFVQMLTDQNFKIVLNTLNVINIIVGMQQQKYRYEKLMRHEMENVGKSNPFQWGISNSCLSKHIPQIVKKLADSKNIIRQEASKSLFLMNDIMRSGNKKDNNFIALILPYLNNSSNWHIREELLNLLIRCFLSSQDKSEFSSIQVLDSILQLLQKDSNDKIRNLALESIVAYASIYYKSNEKNISELLCQLTDDKDVFDLINQRIENGMFPQLIDQQIEFPFFEHLQIQNYDVDSIAHSITNQTQISQGGYSYSNKQNVNTNQIQQQLDIYNRRKKSIGAVSGQINSNQFNDAAQVKNIQRGNSSGRKIIVATANAPKMQNGLSQIEEIINSNYQFNKRTASANNPNFEFENNNKSIKQKHNPSNSFNISAGIVVLEQDQNLQIHQNMMGYNQRNEFQQFQNALYVDDILSNGNNNYSIVSQAQELNGSNFLPSLQKQANNSNIDQKSKPFSQFSNHSDQRIIGSSGGVGLQASFKSNEFDSLQNGKQGYAAGAIKFNNNRPGLQLLTQIGGDINLPNSKTSKRNLKINHNQHGTPGQPPFKYQDQLQKGINLAQNHFNRGNSGKIMGNHQINSNQSDQNASIMYDNSRFQVMNQQLNDSQQMGMMNYSANIQAKLIVGATEINGQQPNYILGGSIGRQHIDQINEINHIKQISALSGSIGNNSNINSAQINVGFHGQDSTQLKIQQKLMSENGYNIENSDVFSMVGMQSHQSTYNQNTTPSHFNNLNQHEQILFSASSGYRQVNQGNLILRQNESGPGVPRQHLNYDKQNLPMQAQGPPEFGFEVDEQIGSSSFNFANLGPHEKFTPDHSMVMQGNDLFSSGAGMNNKNKFDLKSQLLFSEQQNSINNQPTYLNILKDEFQKRNNEQNQAYLNNIYSISGQGSASGQQRNHILSSGESNNRISGLVKKFQNGQSTFYSNGTNMTGVTGATATTGVSGMPIQNREINPILNELQKYQNFNQDSIPINLKNTIQSNDQINQNGNKSQSSHIQNTQQQINSQNQVLGRQGPIKATRFQNNNNQEKQVQQIGQNQNSLYPSSRQQQQEQQNDLVIDTRRVKVGKSNILKQSINSSTGNGNTSIGLFNNSKNFKQLNSKIIGSQTLDNDPLIQIMASSSTENIDQIGNQNQTLRKSDVINLNNDQNTNDLSTNNDNILSLNEEQDPSQTYQIVYTPIEELEALDKPEKEFKKCLSKGQGIYSNDWIKQFEGCQIIRQVCKHHQSLIIQTANQLQNLVSTLIKLVDSLRSAVSRISLMTLNEMFISLKRVMEPCLDPIIKILLKKSSDTNNFIAEVADQCLQSLVQNCQEQKVLQILQLQNMNSRSNLYRLKICQCLQNIVKQLGNNILFFNQNDKLLVLLANYLHDPNQDVRQSSKTAFVCMSQQIMGQNELEKLLQRVLNEVQYKKVKEYLDKEPSHLSGNQSSQIDFLITNVNNNNQNPNCQPIAKKIIPSNKQFTNKQSQKNIKQLTIKNQQQQNSQNNQNADKNGNIGNQQTNPISGQPEQQNQDNLVLNIQSKQIINPQLQKQELNAQKSLLQQNKNGINSSSQQQIQNGLNNVAGNVSQRGASNGNIFFQSGLVNGQKNININSEINQNSHHFDAFFIESLKDCILKTQINDWRTRLEASEALFDFIKINCDKIQNNLKNVELCEAISKLINDANAKIQINALESIQKQLISIFQYLKNHILPLYKSVLTNLGSSNVGVKKISDQIIKQINENLQQDRLQYLLSPLIQIIQNNNNTKLKGALFDQLIELLSDYQQQQSSQSVPLFQDNQNNPINIPSIHSLIQKQIPQIAFKLLEDSKSELKVRCEKLLKKLYQILGQQQLFDQCPQNKLQKVCDICLSNGLISSTGQQSSSQISINKNNNSQNFGTGTFGANGSSLILNSRI